MFQEPHDFSPDPIGPRDWVLIGVVCLALILIFIAFGHLTVSFGDWLFGPQAF